MPDHLGIESTRASVAVITGNPDRVGLISARLGSAREVATRRGFLCHEARVKQTPVLVVATGIGGPSTAIAVEELIDLGVSVIIRIGTCGALQPHIKVGDLVVPTGCVREEGTTAQYIDGIFPAVPDYKLLQELIGHASSRSVSLHVGLVHCKDAYYLEHADKQLDPNSAHHRWSTWRAAGVLVTEMESSTLFVLGSLRGVQTGAIFVNVGKDTPDALLQAPFEQAVDIVRESINALSIGENELQHRPRTPRGSSYLDFGN